MNHADAVIGYTRHSKGDTDKIDTIGNRNLADAASRSGVRRFVLTSILTCDQTPQIPHFWHKKLAEDRLEELGVPFVSLRPGAFFDMITRMGGDPFTKRRLMWLGSPTIPLTFVLTQDLAGYLADAVDAPGVDGQRIDIGGSAGKHAGDRSDFRSAARSADPSADHSGRPDQHRWRHGGQVQPHGQGPDRDDALVPDRPVRRRPEPPTRVIRPNTHPGGLHRQARRQPRTHNHGTWAWPAARPSRCPLNGPLRARYVGGDDR